MCGGRRRRKRAYSRRLDPGYRGCVRRLTWLAGLPALVVLAALATGAGSAAESTSSVMTTSEVRASVLPSGRTTYRVYDDYVREMRALARTAPSLVVMRSIGTTHEGRPIWALEIASEVGRDDDGRPVVAHYGLIHAREWPSGEYLMEFARDLVARHRAGDARIRSALRNARVVLVPVLNADGFVASRQSVAPVGLVPPIDSADGEYRRKNCRPKSAGETVQCALRRDDVGVDLNRNFPAYWGGAGASRAPLDETYAGPGASSEPETRALRGLLRPLQTTVVVAHHTFMEDGAWLRQPGFRDPAVWPSGSVPADAPTLGLSDAMVAATGWKADVAYSLGDTTGASDDWSYVAQGSLVLTAEARGRDFHASYRQMVVAEYTGKVRGARGGVREALLRSVEIAAEASNHAVVKGVAPPGAMLEVERRVVLPVCTGATARDTCTGPAAGPTETLRSKLRVPASGRYVWHLNPTDLPLVGDHPWTMTCVGVRGRGTARTVRVPRGDSLTVDFDEAACGGSASPRAARVAIRTTMRGPVVGNAWVLRAVFNGPGTVASSTAISWDLNGDGRTDRTGRSVVVVPKRVGSSTVTVRARSAGGTATASTVVIARALRPSRVVATTRRLVRGGAIVFRVPHDLYGEPPRVRWDLDGDGAFDDGAGSLVARRYDAAGTYRVAARVTRAGGRVSTPRITLDVRP